MKTLNHSRYVVFIILFSVLAFTGVTQEQPYLNLKPRQIVLTYQNNPQTNITITWRTDQKGEKSIALFSSDSGVELQEYAQKDAETYTFKETKAWIHSVELTNLVPEETYWIVLQTDDQKSKKFNFRTAPTQPHNITFIMGADAQHLRTEMPIIRQVIGTAAKENPDFFIYSGDFVNAELSEYEWDLFFDLADELLITDEGRRIPIVPAIGNHEVVNGYGGDQTLAPFYYQRFKLPEPKNYYSILYNQDLLIISLDSNHSSPIAGVQAAWLKNTLERYKDAKWKIVQYHDGAWWGNESMYVKMRAFWIPLFEKYGVTLVHNGHSHSYKRTAQINNIGSYSIEIDKVVEDGLAKAKIAFDPTKKYAPPLQRNLMKLSRGDWQSTGFSSLFEGLKEMTYMLSLYVIQSGEATKEKVYDQMSTTKLYSDYWAQVLSPDNKSQLADKTEGIVYLTGGGLGATMDAQSSNAERWWIEETKSKYHYRKVTLDVSRGELRIEPKFYDPVTKTWEGKDAITIQK